ncbi:MAG: hypothetical protein ACOVQ8_01565 [Elstera sp.]|jgi:hypothetical protein
MLRLLAPFLTTLGLVACAAGAQVGEKSAKDFAERTEVLSLTSSAPAAQVARCFETQARLLPLSTITYEADTRLYRYRLKAYDLWLEEAEFSDTATGGSEVRFRYATNYDAGWRKMLERDRLGPLKACTDAKG